MGQVLGSFSHSRAISRLLKIGALRTQFQKVTPEMLENNGDSKSSESFLRYESTELGGAIFNYSSSKLGILQPEMIRYFEEKIATNAKDLEKDNPT